MKRRIILVEDDELIRENYAEILNDEGYQVDTFDNAADALAACEIGMPDLAILDIGLGTNRHAGFVLCAKLRQLSQNLPIVFLTSHDSDTDKISGMRLGADDYLTKDTSMDYLVVRLDALFQRHESLQKPGSAAGQVKSIQNLYLDVGGCIAFWREARLELSLTQFWILQCLVENPGVVKSPSELMKAANIVVEPNTIAAHIKTLRRRFREIDTDFNHIKAEYAAGYRWLT
jgi:two-component system, OmpR family, response regulator